MSFHATICAMKSDSNQRSESVSTARTHWADVFVTVLRREIDLGRLVRIALPGAKVPILVEDASRWVDCLIVKDPQGGSYYVAHPAGVVILAEPVQPPPEGHVPYWMKVDD